MSCRCTICTGLTRTKRISFRATSATRSLSVSGMMCTGCPTSALKYLPNSPHVANASLAPLKALTPKLISAYTTDWVRDNKKTKLTTDPRSDLNICIDLLPYRIKPWEVMSVSTRAPAAYLTAHRELRLSGLPVELLSTTTDRCAVGKTLEPRNGALTPSAIPQPFLGA